MRRMTYFVMALALVFGLTQCKKEQPASQNEPDGVYITLTLDGGNSNSRVNVDPTGDNGQYNYAPVVFEEGDVIYVGYGGSYVGQLTCQSDNTTFSGNINVTEAQATQPLDLYFLGGTRFANPIIDGNTATLSITDQTASYPVISYARSTYKNGSHHAMLNNKCSIMKFNVTTPSEAAICITGMNNKVTVDFTNPTGADNGFSYDQVEGGLIKMPGQAGSGEKTYWAIVLPQDELEAGPYGTAYSEDHSYTGQRPALSAIGLNEYHSESVAMTVNNTVIWDNSVISGIDIHSNDGQPVTIDGISVRGEGEPIAEFNWSSITLDGGRLIFSAPSGYGFTRIEIASNDEINGNPEGWNKESVGEWWEDQTFLLVWSNDTPASTVTLPAYVHINVSGITFTLGEVAAPTPPTPTPPTEGVGSLIYDNDNNPIAMVAYVGEDYTLAIRLYDWVAMYDPESESITNFSWDAANSMIQSYNDFTDEAWRLPTVEEWTKMFVACECIFDEWSERWNCDELMTKLNVAGGEPLYKDLDNDYIHFYYWTGTEGDYSFSAKAVDFHKSDGHKIASFVNQDTGNEYLVRPVIQIGGTAPVTPDVTWNINNDFSCDPTYSYYGVSATLEAGEGSGGNQGTASWNYKNGLRLQSGSTYDDVIHPSSLTFSYNYGNNIKKIVITHAGNNYGVTPSGWIDDGYKLIWEGTPSSSVTMMSPDNNDNDAVRLTFIRKVEFFLE